MPFNTMIGANELDRVVRGLGLPYDPHQLSVEELADRGNTHLDRLFDTIGHLIPYDPVIEEALDLPISLPTDPKPCYRPYSNMFKSSQEARSHRKRLRTGDFGRLPKKAADVERVRRYGRVYWVKRLYEAMISITNLQDTNGSFKAPRFTSPNSATMDPDDLEATAHHIFDACLRVHERGWCRPIVYHKNAKRGNLKDIAWDSIERRLWQICCLLAVSKAAVDDALRGGITLALLVDNPTARGATKASNNIGNTKRGKRLNMAQQAIADGTYMIDPETGIPGKVPDGKMVCAVTKGLIDIPHGYMRCPKLGRVIEVPVEGAAFEGEDDAELGAESASEEVVDEVAEAFAGDAEEVGADDNGGQFE